MEWKKLLSYKRTSDKPGSTATTSQARSAFERDYDRIIFSYPFRRLQDKTQVFPLPLPVQDFVHTRLTHSLEVSSVGRSLGKNVGEVVIGRYPELQQNFNSYDFGAIVAAASLAHDLGNPPFGHSGEDAISDFFVNNPLGQFYKDKVTEKQWADLTKFEGNAQGFRILNKKHYQGLNLTYATLAAFSKYPREAGVRHRDKSRVSQKKYGFFQSEKEVFGQIADELGLISLHHEDDLIWTRHPLAFLVEAADDICYNIIDLEDGCRMGLVTFDDTKDMLAGILRERFDQGKMDKISSLNEKVGSLRALAIGKLIEEASSVFLDHENDILEGKFDQSLTDLIVSKDVLQVIKKVSIEKIYRARVVLETEAAGFEVINGLLEAFTKAAFDVNFDRANCSAKYMNIYRLLPDEYRNPPADCYEMLMDILDFISGMTDSFAMSLYRKIKGISLPSV